VRIVRYAIHECVPVAQTAKENPVLFLKKKNQKDFYCLAASRCVICWLSEVAQLYHGYGEKQQNNGDKYNQHSQVAAALPAHDLPRLDGPWAGRKLGHLSS
jgi:hypothetical protein